MYRYILLLALCASCNAQDKSQTTVAQPKIRNTQSTKQAANVRCSLLDSAGNLWFGTTGEGVYRYDGNAFANFTTKDGLSSNTIWCVYEDTEGNIWFGTADGISRYDGKKFTRIPFSALSGIESTVWVDRNGNPSEQNAIWDIMQDKTGTFWFATTNGIYRYDGTSFSHFANGDGVINSTDVVIKKVESILEDNNGTIWFGGRLTEGVFHYDGKSLVNYQSHGKNWLWPVLEDKGGNIWFSNWSGSYRYDGKAFTKFNDRDSSIKVTTCIYEDKAGNLWFGGDLNDASLLRYDGETVKLFTTEDGLSKNSVWCIVEDRAGNLWFGGRNMELHRYNGSTFTDVPLKSLREEE